jgi:hypothetical protein
LDRVLIGASIGALVTIAGWIVTRAREDRTRSLETLLNYRQRQIQEFYAPLHSSLYLIDIGSKTYINRSKGVLHEDQRKQIEQFFDSEYFKNTHREIRELLKTKIYLMEDSNLPNSYLNYLAHAIEEEGVLAYFRKCLGIPFTLTETFGYVANCTWTRSTTRRN